MRTKTVLKFVFLTSLFISIIPLYQWCNTVFNKSPFGSIVLFRHTRLKQSRQLPVYFRYMNLNSLQLNVSIDEKEESVFLGGFENVENYFQNYLDCNNTEPNMEELILKRQIINEVLEMKYFVQSELKKKSTINIDQFLSSLLERKRSLANMILPMLEFAKELQPRNKQFINSNLVKIFSSTNTGKNFELSKILLLNKSVESTVRNITLEVSKNSFWRNNITAINFGLRNTLKDANKFLSDGSDQREQEIAELQDRVQSKLLSKQNPQNCQTSKRLICEANFDCGFGCVVHFLGICMTEALGWNRTLIIEIKLLTYATEWTKIFLPLSNTCSSTGTGKRVSFKDPDAEEALVVFMSANDVWSTVSLFRPGTIPDVIATQLIRLHRDPALWWTGQILHYICRPQPTIEEEINNFMETHRFHEPIVGVHVRRTDKIKENPYVGLHRYMEAVEEWFLQYEVNNNIKNLKRKIYLASDELKVIEEAKKGYPNYEILVYARSNTEYSRISVNGLHTIVVDVHLLSRCNFLVCTMSSNVCRLVYALRQTYKTENSRNFFSMDIPYVYPFSWHRKQIAVKSHQPNSKLELMMTPGDVIDLPWIFWNGYQRSGKNIRKKKEGLFPMYKTRELLILAPYVALDI